MKFSPKIGFLISILAMGFILHLVTFDENRVALSRLDRQLDLEWGLKELIAEQCDTLKGKQGTKNERFFVDRFSPTGGAEARPCQVTVLSANASRFSLSSSWNFLIRLERGQEKEETVLFQRNYGIGFPRPLALLPLAIFLLSLVFDVRAWGIGWTAVTYAFLVSGANINALEQVVGRTAVLTVTAHPSFFGLTLMLLWLSLFLSDPARQPEVLTPTNRRRRTLNRSGAFFLGLWNPLAFTLLGRLLYPLKSTVARINPFLDAQFVVAALSLYLLSVDLRSFREVVEMGLFLPRYFTFAALLLIVLNRWLQQPPKHSLVWPPRFFFRAAGFIAAGEIAALWVPYINQLPTLVRVGGALVLSELVWPKALSPKETLRRFIPWTGILFLASFLSMLTMESGVADLFLVITEPRIHPNAIVFFTFLAGLTLGFLTGNFSITFFAMFAVLKSHALAQPRAALLDGILAGALLSPFSLHNLFPAVQFGIGIRRVVAQRFRQLAFPLLIGTALYGISTFTTVGILQPVTFVFLCLVILAFEMKKSTWRLAPFNFVDPATDN